MEYKTILVQVDDRVATSIINRPELMNAFAPDTYYEIGSACTELGQRADVGAVVITGAGKHFSAGGDIKRFKQLVDSGEFLNARNVEAVGRAMVTGIQNCPKPVIAMINGVATGAGLSCALACDFRVVEPKSKMIMGFVNMGLSGDNGGIYNLIRLVGPEKAKLMLMTGDPVKGEAAVQMGLATLLAEEGKLAEAAYGLAKKLAGKSSFPHGKQKALINKYFYGALDAYYTEEADMIAECSRQPDFAEAVNAFIEKRPPQYNKG